MEHIIYHFLGFCGDLISHPTLFTTLIGGGIVGYVVSKKLKHSYNNIN
jgi:hypothetical protein